MMIRLFFFFVWLFFLLACNDNNKPSVNVNADSIAKDTNNFTTLQWIDSVANFGVIKQGEKVEVKFRFTNTGSKPLYLLRVQPGCGCTSPDYSKEPIAPGKEGWVKGIFNSNNQMGIIHKSIMVTANTLPKPDHQIFFEGEVVQQQ